MEDAYYDMVLFSCSTWKFKMTVGAELTVMYPLVYLAGTGDEPNLINADFAKPLWDSRTECQNTPRLWTVNKQSLPVMTTIALHLFVG